MKTYKFYSDSGHGWLAVKRDELKKLKIFDQISSCSYQSKSGKTVYLEEDRDMQIFVNAYKKEYGQINIVVTRHERRSRIRGCNRFHVSGTLDGLIVGQM